MQGAQLGHRLPHGRDRTAYLALHGVRVGRFLPLIEPGRFEQLASSAASR
jgi:hypothetical protein